MMAMIDPVTNDLARHLSELDKESARDDRIYSEAQELCSDNEGMGTVLSAIYENNEWEAMFLSLLRLIQSGKCFDSKTADATIGAIGQLLDMASMKAAKELLDAQELDHKRGMYVGGDE